MDRPPHRHGAVGISQGGSEPQRAALPSGACQITVEKTEVAEPDLGPVCVVLRVQAGACAYVASLHIGAQAVGADARASEGLIRQTRTVRPRAESRSYTWASIEPVGVREEACETLASLIPLVSDVACKAMPLRQSPTQRAA